MLWVKINAKLFVTIFSFKIFGKTGSFAVLICYIVSLHKPVHFNAKIGPTTYSQLLKTIISNSKFDVINQRLKNVHGAWYV